MPRVVQPNTRSRRLAENFPELRYLVRPERLPAFAADDMRARAVTLAECEPFGELGFPGGYQSTCLSVGVNGKFRDDASVFVSPSDATPST